MSSAMHLDAQKSISSEYRHAIVRYDEEMNAALLYMYPEPRPCFTLGLLQDILHFQKATADKVKREIDHTGKSNIRYMVFASNLSNIYSFGGDLGLFIQLIEKKDRESLLNYARQCIQVVYQYSNCFDLPLRSIALVQGDALGGGFEAALSCHVIIAERGTRMGFPEVLFNLFPGMGAYSFLRQRINPALAERLILSGKLYPVEELHEMGVVDYLTEPGKGHEVLRKYVHDDERYSNARDLITYTRTTYNKVSKEELLEITELWVDSALTLSDRELKTMQRLVRAQDNKVRQSALSMELVKA